MPAWLFQKTGQRRPSTAPITTLAPKSKVKNADNYLRRFYKISLAQRDALLESQGGRCANPGCRTDTPGGNKTFHLDHDHSCCPGDESCGKCIRGLLCHDCNVGSGLFDDDPVKLQGHADYLKAWADRKAGK